MVQVKIYGIRDYLNPIKQQLSDVIHSCVMDALQFPANKRSHRFFPLDKSDFYYPAGRTERYTIIELSMIEGRSVAAKKQLIKLLFERSLSVGITAQDLEITIFENPKHNWGFRGLPGDEHELNYKIEV
ncbi:tautomerase family protein [Calothrix sp. FACHB-1219]|uniref:tautomerase family protein n=1 Tax=unclassified Calothrix TaxID=2619626 RepID=UPI00168238BE|nr:MULTISPECIES: tautomerase family protein [unclassified Calothrix]MBD2206056.1 tautomerase family protein [Calothrix sp. FACHB-168]MBD2220769.1 tautomerase family protein [Calothrix sp. FACHB-1219]